jgi:hypothetical protein
LPFLFFFSHRIPAAKDFVRLITPFPLAYGAMFTEQPIPFDQWSVGESLLSCFIGFWFEANLFIIY